MTRFAGRRALVTGAGSGIGAAVARLLEAEDAEVVAADISGTDVHLDVRDEAEVAAVAHDVDVLVNVAGIGSTTRVPVGICIAVMFTSLPGAGRTCWRESDRALRCPAVLAWR